MLLVPALTKDPTCSTQNQSIVPDLSQDNVLDMHKLHHVTVQELEQQLLWVEMLERLLVVSSSWKLTQLLHLQEVKFQW
jgi:hypothetical protein